MKNKTKKRITAALGLLLAVAMVMGLGTFFRDSALKAAEEDETVMAENPVQLQPELVVEEVTVAMPAAEEENAPAEPAEETREAAPTEENTAEEALTEPESTDEEVHAAEETAVEEAAAEEPAEEAVETEGAPETAETNYQVTITCNLGPDSRIAEGDIIILTAQLSGFEGKTVSYQWLVLRDGAWVEIPGATAVSYSFAASAESMALAYNVIVTIAG